jgi:structural maintenance of chromosome 1
MTRGRNGSSSGGELLRPDGSDGWPICCQGHELTPSINTTGQSTYYLNNKAVQWSAYNAQLETFNILVKAKNFLVFQGDVEGIASQDSKALAKLIDRISG